MVCNVYCPLHLYFCFSRSLFAFHTNTPDLIIFPTRVSVLYLFGIIQYNPDSFIRWASSINQFLILTIIYPSFSICYKTHSSILSLNQTHHFLLIQLFLSFRSSSKCVSYKKLSVYLNQLLFNSHD
jgi:hypothetical protein